MTEPISFFWGERGRSYQLGCDESEKLAVDCFTLLPTVFFFYSRAFLLQKLSTGGYINEHVKYIPRVYKSLCLVTPVLVTPVHNTQTHTGFIESRYTWNANIWTKTLLTGSNIKVWDINKQRQSFGRTIRRTDLHMVELNCTTAGLGLGCQWDNWRLFYRCWSEETEQQLANWSNSYDVSKTVVFIIYVLFVKQHRETQTMSLEKKKIFVTGEFLCKNAQTTVWKIS